MGEGVRIMIHDSTWLARTRAMRRMRLVAPLGLLLAGVLLASFAASAFASTVDIRGEWAITLKTKSNTLLGTSVIIAEPNAQEEFASATTTFDSFIPGTFSGTLEGSKATVTMTTSEVPSPPAPAPVPPGKFESATGAIAVIAGTGTLELSGEGTFTVGDIVEKGTLEAKRIKTYQQLEQEQLEKEEREARPNIRGEWALTLEAGPETLKGIAVIDEEATTQNDFASESAMFEGSQDGTFTGTLKGPEASVTITTEGNATLEIPPGSFTSGTIAVSPIADPTSMSGEGTFTSGAAKLTGKLTATRIKTYQQVLEREESERKAKEQQEKEAQEAQEAKEKAEQEAKVKAEQEAKAKREREAREAIEKAEKIVPPPPGPSPLPTPNPVTIASKELSKGATVGHSRVVTI